MMSKIKICGLTRMCDIEAVNQAMPDYIGFVFAKSKRQVDDQTAAALKSALNGEINAVGVFVNDEISHIAKLCDERVIDLVQLHGDEDNEYIVKLKEEISVPIMKAIRVQTKEQVLSACRLSCDFLLLDTYCEKTYGGSGKAFDWTIIGKPDKPFFLAGGLHSDNIMDAIKMVHPYCVDISSGVECNGLKDKYKISRIVKQIRRIL